MKKYLPILLVAAAFPSFVMAQALLDAATSTDLGAGDVATSSLVISQDTASTTAATTSDSAGDQAQSAATTTQAAADVVPAAAKAIHDVIADDEARYFAEHGVYLPVLPGNKLLPGMSGTVAERLGHDIPADAFIETFAGPSGKGYRVLYTAGTKRYSAGHGPDATPFTYSYDVPQSTSNAATSTPASVDSASSSESTSTDASTTPITLLGASSTSTQ